MNPRRRAICFLGVCWFSHAALAFELEFRGVAVSDGTTEVLLMPPATDGLYRWQRIGDKLGNVSIQSYDPKLRVLTVHRGDEVHQLPLQTGTVSTEDADLPGTLIITAPDKQKTSSPLTLQFGIESRIAVPGGVQVLLTPLKTSSGGIDYFIRYRDGEDKPVYHESTRRKTKNGNYHGKVSGHIVRFERAGFER